MFMHRGIGASEGGRLNLVLAVTLCSITTFAAAADIKEVIGRCESCHGPGGESQHDGVPSLAGRDERYIIEAIDEFYFFERHCPTRKDRDEELDPDDMCVIASELAEEEIAELARYFASRKAASEDRAR